MKFTKLIHFDVRNGICKNVGLILAPFIIALISFVDFNRKFYPLALAASSASNVIPTYADHIMYIYGGMAQYINLYCGDNRIDFLSLLLYPFKSLQALLFQGFWRFFHFCCHAGNLRIFL